MKMLISTCKHTLHRGLRLTLALALLLAACTTQDWPYSPHREGVGSIAVTLEGSQTRATTSVITKEEADLFLVTLYKGEDLIAQREGFRLTVGMSYAQLMMLGLDRLLGYHSGDLFSRVDRTLYLFDRVILAYGIGYDDGLYAEKVSEKRA